MKIASPEETLLTSLNAVAAKASPSVGPVSREEIVVERPPTPELGDLAFPMFPFAKRLRMSPAAIATEVATEFNRGGVQGGGVAKASGPYVNVEIDTARTAQAVVENVEEQASHYGYSNIFAGRRIMIEFSSPNTNKPLHLGHLRNDALGASVSQLLKACGAEVRRVNLINDRGIHICKSMAAYEHAGRGDTPESRGMKGDHFVGEYYVLFAKWEKDDPSAEERARELLRRWEASDPAVLDLWKRMNDWAISGIEETYRRTGIAFDAVYHESETYRSGREEILAGLQRGLFYTEADGSVWVDLDDVGLDKKVLLRGDGTSLYVTQDIGTVIARHKDYPFDRMVYVVASEQQHHFRVLFEVLRRLGFTWASSLFHLSYGMVNLPDGRMKSREGTVVDADDLLDELTAMALEEIKQKGREAQIERPEETATAIALGALNYYLLQVTTAKDMVFRPEESLSFNGNTGPYLQYTGARICSMLRKYEARARDFSAGVFRPTVIRRGDEWEIVKLIGEFPRTVERAARELAPSVVAGYLYDLAQVYSRYYHDVPILHDPDPDTVVTRVALSRCVAQVLRNGCALLGIPFLEVM